MTARKRILNVDDDDAGRYATTRILKHAGFDVLEAASGRDALLLVETEHPDLILLDVNLPDMSGFEVCKQIKARPLSASTPVVHLSAIYAQSRHRTEGLEGGADGYLVQPVEPQELVATLRAFLRLKEAEQALRESEERYRSLVNNIPIGFCRCTPGAEGRFLMVNPAFLKIFGIEGEENLQKLKVFDLCVVSQEMKAFYNTLMLQGYATGVELRFRKTDGTPMWYTVTASVVSDVSGNVLYYDSSFEDITRRKQAEDDLKIERDKLRALSARVLQIQEVERQRLSRELHDEIGQTLTMIKLGLQMIGEKLGTSVPELYEKIQDIVALFDSLLERVRQQSFSLRPPSLDDLGLIAAVQYMAGGFARRTGISVDVRTDEYSSRLPVDVETALYRCIQEALTNVARHARANSVKINFRQDAAGLLIRIRDDGIGFDTGSFRNPAEHIGLIGMEERVELLCGSFKIHSRPGAGTTIDIRVPLQVKEQ